MTTIHSHLKMLSVLLLFVLVVTVFERADTIARFLDSDQAVAAVSNPVASFLGIAPAEQASVVNTNTETTTTDTSLLGSIRAFLNGTDTRVTTTTAAVTARANTPTLICVPSVTDGVEETILMWACNDGAQSASGSNFDTSGASIGSMRVQSESTATYGVTCEHEDENIETTTATCTVQVVEPTLSIESTEDTVVTGDTTTISWMASEVRSCKLASNYDATFSRTGLVGSAITHNIYKDTTFTLSCESATGLEVHNSINVYAQ